MKDIIQRAVKNMKVVADNKEFLKQTARLVSGLSAALFEEEAVLTPEERYKIAAKLAVSMIKEVMDRSLNF